MKRIIEIIGKNGVIDIYGNPLETIFYLRGKPIQYSWFAEVGSTWRYHLAQGLNKQSVKLNLEIQRILKEGVKNEGEFLAITEYFNQFFVYGKYEYGYFELFNGIYWVDIPHNEEYDCFDYYGGCLNISPTQNIIDDTIVETYKEEILKGKRPTMVILHIENSHMFFILDGHHKFKAYKLAEIAPYAIVITKLGNEYKSYESTLYIAKQMQCNKIEYLKRMKESKENLNYYIKQKIDLDKLFRRIKKDNNK